MAGNNDENRLESDRPVPGRSPKEVLFLSCLMAGTLIASIGFVLATIVGGYPFPSTMVAILMAVFIATLAYTFLGGVHGAAFKLGGMQLAGSTAVIIIVVYAVKGPLSADMNDARLIDAGRNAEATIQRELEKTIVERRLRQEAQQRSTELEEAELRANRDVVVQVGQPASIVGGGSVTLTDVDTLNSPYEGYFDPATNQFRTRNLTHRSDTRLPDANHIFDNIIRIVGIGDRTRQQFLNMSEQDWADYLKRMERQRRERITLTPFASLVVESNDHHRQERTAFRGEQIAVLTEDGRIEAYLCVRHVFDTRINSGEPEAVVLTHSRRPCVS